jgi:hypothetical protein
MNQKAKKPREKCKFGKGKGTNIWQGNPVWVKMMEFIYKHYADNTEVLAQCTLFEPSSFTGWLYYGKEPSKNTYTRIADWYAIYEDGEFPPAPTWKIYMEYRILHYGKTQTSNADAYRDLIKSSHAAYAPFVLKSGLEVCNLTGHPIILRHPRDGEEETVQPCGVIHVASEKINEEIKSHHKRIATIAKHRNQLRPEDIELIDTIRARYPKALIIGSEVCSRFYEHVVSLHPIDPRKWDKEDASTMIASADYFHDKSAVFATNILGSSKVCLC